MIGFIIYELTSKQSHEGKLKAMDERTSRDRMNGHKPNERKQRMNERTRLRLNEPNNRTSEIPAKQTENDQWHEQTPANPVTQQMAASACLVQNIESVSGLALKTVEIDLIMLVKKKKTKNLVE